ncbi:putative transporter [Smittium mucronatum]|uniref:Putative transporter n=1 Tax=Smittium mucronatum TaxID=133383 RepID=A0A1R0GX91_9FUNG|nr:putative transporter [Smittium mucronatum]
MSKYSESKVGIDLESKPPININVSSELTEEESILIKKCLMKMDLRILPIVILIYICALMDRSNIGSALVNGLKEGLNLNTTEEGNVTSMFYIFYILCETPSNILLKKFKPHAWFAFIGCGWSIACIGLAFVKNGAVFVVLRCILGALEAGLTPGIVGYLAYWYTRSEIGFRMTLFFSAVPISGIIGSPLAALFASINLKGFYKFQNIFLLEGVLTLAICFASFFLIRDYPDQANFFTPEEKELVVRRLKNEQGMASETHASFKQTISAMLDWKMWVFAVIFYGLNNAYVVLGIFAPTLIKSFGYDSIQSTYLAIIPNAVGLFGTMFVLSQVDKRSYVSLICFNAIISIIGYSVASFTTAPVLRLVFIGIAGFGSMANIPLSLSWMSVNQGGIYKGMIASALVVSFGSICGVVSPRLYVLKFKPHYYIGNFVTIFAIVLSVILSIVLSLYFKAQNRYRDSNPVDLSYMNESEQRGLNDKHPNFRYKL